MGISIVGETITNKFKLPASTDLQILKIYYKQNSNIIIERDLSQVTKDGQYIYDTFTEDESLKFSPGEVRVQLAVKIGGNIYKSKIKAFSFKAPLKGGKIDG